jgi:sulfofructose kinase
VMGAALAATRLARGLAIPVVGDVETVSDPRSSELISRIDHLVISQELACELTGAEEPEAAVAGLAGPDRACCVVTAGEKGCWYSERGRDVQHFPAFRVDVVDTTGCGDVFHGAYAAGIARGESVTRSIEIATAAAGIKATWPGGRTGIPDLNTLDLFLKEHTRGQQDAR